MLTTAIKKGRLRLALRELESTQLSFQLWSKHSSLHWSFLTQPCLLFSIWICNSEFSCSKLNYSDVIVSQKSAHEIEYKSFMVGVYLFSGPTVVLTQGSTKGWYILHLMKRHGIKHRLHQWNYQLWPFHSWICVML